MKHKLILAMLFGVAVLALTAGSGLFVVGGDKPIASRPVIKSNAHARTLPID